MKSAFVFAALAALALLGFSTYEALYVAPPDALQGNVFRIFYYHVPCAWMGGVCFFLNFCASLWFLFRKNQAVDAFALASAEVGVVFCTIVLITGPLWARPIWGIWWTWDPRLTSTFVLWLIYVSYLIVRKFATGGQGAVLGAALAIFGFVDVPIVYFSIRIFRTQHPQPVFAGGQGSGVDPRMLHPFFWNLLAFTLVGLVILWARYAVQRLDQEVDDAHKQAALAEGGRA